MKKVVFIMCAMLVFATGNVSSQGHNYRHAFTKTFFHQHFNNAKLQRGEFETTQEFNKRVDTETEHRFKQAALETTVDIMGFLKNRDGNRGYWFIWESYDADRGVLIISGAMGVTMLREGVRRGDMPSRFFEPFANIPNGTMSIPPHEARLFREQGAVDIINPLDIYVKDYIIYPTKVTFILRADTTKQYIAYFPKPNGATDIVFRGRELWADNPKARNLSHNYKDLVAKVLEQDSIKAEEQARIAEEQARITERWWREVVYIEAWARRMNDAVLNNRTLVLKAPDGDIRFEIGKPFPNLYTEYKINGETVRFRSAGGFIECGIGNTWELRWSVKGRKNVIRNSEWNSRGNRNFTTSPPDFIGFGIFDVE